MKSIRQLKSLTGRRVLLRIDANVPVSHGRVASDGTIRLDAVLPTVRYLLKRNARVVLVAHRGRPKGKRDEDLSLRAVARYFQRALGQRLKLIETFDDEARKQVHAMDDGDVVMLENIRFHPGEDANDRVFSRWLAQLADVYVNDAFGVCHRTTASMVGVARLLPAYAGLLLHDELRALDEVLKRPKHPLVVIMGGVKAETKIPVIQNLLRHSDAVLLGGVLANTFFGVARGHKMGDVSALLQRDMKRLLDHEHIRLPHDVVVYDKKTDRVEEVDLLTTSSHPRVYDIMDIGSRTAAHYADMIMMAKMVVWNGPLGKFEESRFAKGTNIVARAIAKTSARVYAGGGETLRVIKKLKIADDLHHVSTGGGAMLAYLAHKKLPGLEVLNILKK